MGDFLMATSLQWVASFSASCFHAADAMVRGAKLVDGNLAPQLSQSALALRETVRGSGLPETRLWRQLLALSHQIENNRELAATAIRKTSGGSQHEALAGRLAGRIADLEAAMHRAAPQMMEELAHRGRPIRELWEAYGPGLLRAAARQTDDRLLISGAEVVLVHPVSGGGGTASLSNNSVRFEAVLTNSVPQLPEVLRLTWLLAQLNNDLPVFSEGLDPDRLPLISSLAMLPVALHAGQELELCSADPAILPLALNSWPMEVLPAGIAETLTIWWQTYQETRPSWGTALQALDQML